MKSGTLVQTLKLLELVALAWCYVYAHFVVVACYILWRGFSMLVSLPTQWKAINHCFF
jgi:hypothetical protein